VKQQSANANGSAGAVGTGAGVPRAIARDTWALVGAILCGIALLAAYHVVIKDLLNIWLGNQDYSYGILVLPFACYLAWRKRDVLSGLRPSPSLLGLVVLAAAAGLRVWAVTHFYGSLERYSLVLAIWGLVVLIFGRKVAWRLKGPLLFLMLMVPLPGMVESAIRLPLQRFAASVSAGVLDVMGWNAVSKGNLIRLYGQDLEVAAACNGLRMIFAFIVLGCSWAYLMRRPLWERLVVAASSLAIGLMANVIRIVATGIVSQLFSASVSTRAVHDVAGWLMVPMALGLLWAEAAFLSSLFVVETPGYSGT